MPVIHCPLFNKIFTAGLPSLNIHIWSFTTQRGESRDPALLHHPYIQLYLTTSKSLVLNEGSNAIPWYWCSCPAFLLVLFSLSTSSGRGMWSVTNKQIHWTSNHVSFLHWSAEQSSGPARPLWAGQPTSWSVWSIFQVYAACSGVSAYIGHRKRMVPLILIWGELDRGGSFVYVLLSLVNKETALALW